MASAGKLEKLEKDVALIKQRNRRVEADKSWEESGARKALVFVLTYLAAANLFLFARLPDPFVNALVPAIAFALPGLPLGFFKKIWLRNAHERRQ